MQRCKQFATIACENSEKVEHAHTKSMKELVAAEAARAGMSEVQLCRKHPEYRRISQLARSSGNSVFQNDFSDVLLRWNITRRITCSAIALARKLRLDKGRLLGVESNLNLLRGAVREAGSWKTFQAEFWRRLPVLVYHHIGAPKPGAFPELTIEPAQFAREMQWLDENGYVPIRAAEWLHWCDSAAPLPAKPVLITFDDAYEDLVAHAFPVLRKHGFPAIVFVPTAYVGKSNTWDQVKGGAPFALMTAEAIREWGGKGIEFGAHSRTHPKMDSIGRAALVSELEGSREDVERLIGAPVVSFAYPYGNYNHQVREATGRNFRLAFTMEDGLNSLGTDLLEMHRTMVKPGQSLLQFASRVRVGHHILKGAKAKVRRMMGLS